MNRRFPICAAMLAAVLLAGCASRPPARYYTLDMRPSGHVTTAVNLRIERLRECEALGRKDILVRKNPTQIEYYALDQWVAAPGEMVSQKLESEFGQPQVGRKTIVVTGMILEFGQVDVSGGAEADIRLALEFRSDSANRYDEPLLKKAYEVKKPASARTPAAVVQSLSDCLEDIAVQIAGDAAAL
ncbi:MAG: ABC-type transport auxiliary lipoprotein family protein [Candidatus Hydrogenedentes bacterium]|nr:ABC-type transport auxiliary lipoprotein family protein [Candidatus Hydrogenedentota bacterium]